MSVMAISQFIRSEPDISFHYCANCKSTQKYRLCFFYCRVLSRASLKID